MDKEERVVETLAKVAAFYRKRPSTVTSWKNSGCPALQGPGPYDLEAVGEWLLHRDKADKKPKNGPASNGLSTEYLKARTKLYRMKAELESYRVARENGRLLYSDDVEELLVRQAQEFRQELLNLPRSHSHIFVGIESVEQAEERLRAMMTEIMSRLAFINRGNNEKSLAAEEQREADLGSLSGRELDGSGEAPTVATEPESLETDLR